MRIIMTLTQVKALLIMAALLGVIAMVATYFLQQDQSKRFEENQYQQQKQQLQKEKRGHFGDVSKSLGRL